MYKFCKTEQSFQRQRELEQGLLAMMEHRQFEEISVSDLCNRLNIPRKSFYRYFSSKDGALHALLDHTLLEFYDAGSLEGLRCGMPKEDLVRFFRFWLEHKNLLEAVIRSNLAGMLVERAVALAKKEELMHSYADQWEAVLRDAAMSFVVCGLMSMVLQWHREGYRLPVEQMAKTAVEMLSRPLLPNL